MTRLLGIGSVLSMVLALVVGCESTPEEPYKGQDVFWSYPSYVPVNSVTLAEGTGRLEAQAPEAGTVYLIDLDQSVSLREEEGESVKVPKVVVSGVARAGQTVLFDPAAGTVGVRNGREPLKLRNINPDHRYQIRLAPEEKKD